MEVTKTLYVRTRAAWRAWLKKHHKTAKEIWLIYYRKSSGKPRISYNDAVDQALCFGWIDSIAKPIDHESWAQRFTPRRKGSQISETNKARLRGLIRRGEMTPIGLKALGKVRLNQRLILPADIARAIRKDPEAWKQYRRLPLNYRRIRLAFITGARHRPEMYRRRLAHFIKMTAQGKRFGMIQE